MGYVLYTVFLQQSKPEGKNFIKKVIRKIHLQYFFKKKPKYKWILSSSNLCCSMVTQAHTHTHTHKLKYDTCLLSFATQIVDCG